MRDATSDVFDVCQIDDHGAHGEFIFFFEEDAKSPAFEPFGEEDAVIRAHTDDGECWKLLFYVFVQRWVKGLGREDEQSLWCIPSV